MDFGVTLRADSQLDLLVQRGAMEELGDFSPRSSAEGTLSINPSMSFKKVAALFKDFKVLSSVSSDGEQEERLLRRDGVVLHLDFHCGFVNLRALSTRQDAAAKLAGLLRRLEPFKFVDREEEGVWADFSYCGGSNVVRMTQFCRAPRWGEIEGNYPPATRKVVGGLLGLERPWEQGRLLIWHGPPGTGKTFAIRSLMMAWKDRFSFLVVTDPERLAADPSYYYRVASRSDEHPGRPHLPGVEEVQVPRRRRQVFVLEDTADLILEESRSTHYDKVSKLLNMTDGLFGQGREDLFLVTFNEAIDRIDPAFLRPGRCIAKVEFPRFGADDAAAWMREQGVEGALPSGESTLAELYARRLGRKKAVVESLASVHAAGFGQRRAAAR